MIANCVVLVPDDTSEELDACRIQVYGSQEPRP